MALFNFCLGNTSVIKPMKNFCKVDNSLIFFFLLGSYAVYKMFFYVVEGTNLWFCQRYGKGHLPSFCVREYFVKIVAFLFPCE